MTVVLRRLSPIVRGWSAYYRTVVRPAGGRCCR
ncbi:group II intron maturase-specific domain-containing protein [Streptomyces sp. NPDC054765]